MVVLELGREVPTSPSGLRKQEDASSRPPGALAYVLGRQWPELVAARSVKAQQELVVAPEALAVAHREERDAQRAAALVQLPLDVDGHGAAALVEDRKLGPAQRGEETRGAQSAHLLAPVLLACGRADARTRRAAFRRQTGRPPSPERRRAPRRAQQWAARRSEQQLWCTCRASICHN